MVVGFVDLEADTGEARGWCSTSESCRLRSLWLSEGLLMGALDGSDFGELMVAFACTSGCGSEGCLLW
ncbi:hypothetical protein V6N12_038735 [Hibiscus sabdariffa]|uniref:Uncharacterized protein n=1 Tax=Hibiscus sabdariffa TaxID=183260 RepID=A0ABR2CCE8_9ROSI